MKKPTPSEIRAHYEGMVAKDTAALYLLDLVERIGKILFWYYDNCSDCKHYDTGEYCYPCEQARELLKELKQ